MKFPFKEIIIFLLIALFVLIGFQIFWTILSIN